MVPSVARLPISNPAPVDDLIRSERLPEDFARTVADVYAPIVEVLGSRISPSSDEPAALVGLNGCPGSGKSTFARFAAHMLDTHRIVVLSLDDFYLPASDRIGLSNDVHSLLRRRGMPGTHDVELLIETISVLREAKEDSEVRVPVFDKSMDDRLDESKWSVFEGRPDIILLEGWCVGLDSQSEDELVEPISDWESKNDPDGVWRRYVNQQLKDRYSQIFDDLDMLILLKAPTVETIFKWRREQEEKLRQVGDAMDDAKLREFMMQFSRLTRHMYSTLPRLADILVEFEEDRTLRRLRCN